MSPKSPPTPSKTTTMPKAAIYARFSSDLQRDRSIEDQIAVCRDYADRMGHEVVEVYADRARSGASLHGRDGMLRLLADGRERIFDVVIAETMSRIGRDEGDRANIRKQLTFSGVKIMTPTDGEVTRLTDGIKAIIDSQYLEDLKVMIRRGMAGVTRDGRHAGGRAYGYRPVPGKPGELEIHEEEAQVVRRIFENYVAGKSPRGIAGELNAERLPPPRGVRWNASTINGNKTRGHGILLNPLYAGEIVWNRVRMVKDPDTGKRISRVNPENEWMRADAPHLAIIDRPTFDAAQARKGERTHMSQSRRRAPRHLLSGLLKCGCCGAGMSIKDRRGGRVRVQCTASKESGSCDHRTPYFLDTIEPVVVDGLRERLASPEAIALYLKTYNDERRRLAADSINRRAKLEARHRAVSSELERAIQLTIKGVLAEDDAKAEIARLKAERATIVAELEQTDEAPKVVELHPAAVRAYLDAIERLATTLRENGEHGHQEAYKPIRDLVDSVTIQPMVNGPFMIEVTGHLQKLIGGAHFPHARLGGYGGSGGPLPPIQCCNRVHVLTTQRADQPQSEDISAEHVTCDLAAI
ncbi:recombinase family protein [Nitratireductor sp. ZSWI3]|uniref:recombinase family protein n=1 Tax=Nitratireductor sp. ZSWI3 TaxID=2966359 RepID=UPI00215062EE|nr:recombinase family protein [Nitratireductor sp. ZSWI3]MCR4266451.1 recombinase family protein [Nitratireductor sp. ZSWI3]